MHAVERLETGPAQPTQSPESPPTTAGELPTLCPYLASVDGNWRSSSAVREHRCTAATPALPLALEKQRRLCLVADHATCATYLAAVAARPPVARGTGSGPRAVARTTPVILDHGRLDLRLPAFRPDRVSGQGLLVALLGLAFVAILIARPGGGGDGKGGIGASTSPGPTTAAVASATAAVASATVAPSSPPSAAPVVTARPVATATPTTPAEPTRAPASAAPGGSGATYTVKSGDTLSAIAARYRTTVKVLVTLNKIADPSRLKIGQVLRLP